MRLEEPRPALEGDVATRFLATLLARPMVERLLSSNLFSVDGTMIQAWSSMKSIKPIEPGAGDGAFLGWPQRGGELPRQDAHQRLDH